MKSDLMKMNINYRDREKKEANCCQSFIVYPANCSTESTGSEWKTSKVPFLTSACFALGLSAGDRGRTLSLDN